LQLSIVIPTRNRASKLERTLQSLLLQTIPTQDFEVVVVDNDSGDETPEFLRRFGKRFPNWQSFRQPKPGAAAARNAGIASCQGAIVLFIDDDVIAQPDLVRQHLKSHDSHSGCAVLGRVLDGWDQNDSAFHWVISHKELLHSFRFPDSSNVPFQHLYTCNASISRDLLLKAGLFDERFRGAAFEDTDLGYRLTRSGCQLLFNPEATVLHEPLLSLKLFMRKRFDAGCALYQLLSKHPELETTMLPSWRRRSLRWAFGWSVGWLTFTFDKHLPLAPLLLPVLGKACWYHFEYLFWTGYQLAARSQARTTNTAVCRPAG
jgi:glycosyltransferase involved in cell wall biosynthesis